MNNTTDEKQTMWVSHAKAMSEIMVALFTKLAEFEKINITKKQ